MIRREAISVLLGSVPAMASRLARLDRFLDPREGCALLLDIRSREFIASNSNALSGRFLAPPGSALKPLTLATIAVAGRLRAGGDFICPEKLTLAGRHLDCSHPRLAAPMRVDTALAYSCNCFVANAAAKLGPSELARGLQNFGFDAQPQSDERQQLQALGEAGILVTPEALVRAYRQLALQPTRPGMQEILAGLEGAVDFGTGQLARVAWAQLAGKTGSTRMGSQFLAWFAGFVPSRAPEVAIVVILSGRHGGSDAAPVAAKILDAWHSGRL
jgi:cell division protein FtsI/penicillin-binding protein 2